MFVFFITLLDLSPVLATLIAKVICGELFFFFFMKKAFFFHITISSKLAKVENTEWSCECCRRRKLELNFYNFIWLFHSLLRTSSWILPNIVLVASLIILFIIFFFRSGIDVVFVLDVCQYHNKIRFLEQGKNMMVN